MLLYQPFVVTSLLLVLYYSGFGFYASFTVFAVTVITTYICFTLKTKLRLERFFKFLVSYGFGKYIFISINQFLYTFFCLSLCELLGSIRFSTTKSTDSPDSPQKKPFVSLFWVELVDFCQPSIRFIKFQPFCVKLVYVFFSHGFTTR